MSDKKNITLISTNFYPEDSAIGLYSTQFAEFLISKGYLVTVIAGFPYYPQWKINKKYALLPSFYKETFNEIEIFRHKQYVPKKVNFIGRILLLLSVLYGTIINSWKVKKSDLVICIIPFTLSCFAGYLLSKRTKSKLWIHIQDFEFDLAFESGILKPTNFWTQMIKKSVFKSESFILNKAAVVSSISYTMLNKLKTKSTVKNIFYFPNWVDAETINPANFRKHNYINPDKFTLLYSGNIGEKQDWNIFEQICSCININDNIEIIIVGSGSYLETLKEKSKKYLFVHFYPLVKYSELSNLLCSADVHFLFQKTNVIDSLMPSKLLGMMASEKPSIVTGNKDSEVAKIFEKSNGGYYFDNDAINTIFETIILLKNNEKIRIEKGNNAREFVLNQYSENEIFNSVEQKIQSVFHEK
ncbi:glycosyltransferase [Flavobacterium sp.]|uniref:glycosyltransferase n=1 Tax=Flavobacterium sp. TaxID=239 RepID=UPI00286B36DE|nr:glycosyltransferase [Flavobacterium sp.]